MAAIEPDLSFTQDPEWIAEREACWKPIEDDLKSINRKSKVALFKQLFFTGKCDDHETFYFAARSGAIVFYYPLQTAEGWDYAFQNQYLQTECYKALFKDALMGTYNDWIKSPEARLRFFDYFHPATYQPVIKSRVPIGREQKAVEIEVDANELLASMLALIAGFVRRNESPVIAERLDYLFSCLDAVGNLGGSLPLVQRRIKSLVESFINQYFDFAPEIEIPDPSEQKAFLTRFYNHIANNPVHPSIKAIWQKVVAEHE